MCGGVRGIKKEGGCKKNKIPPNEHRSEHDYACVKYLTSSFLIHVITYSVIGGL